MTMESVHVERSRKRRRSSHADRGAPRYRPPPRYFSRDHQWHSHRTIGSLFSTYHVIAHQVRRLPNPPIMGAAMTTTDRADYALITRRAGLRAGLHVNACRRWLMCCASAYTVNIRCAHHCAPRVDRACAAASARTALPCDPDHQGGTSPDLSAVRADGDAA